MHHTTNHNSQNVKFQGSWQTFLYPAQEHGDKAKPVSKNNTPLDRYATASWQLATIREDADNSLTGQMVERVKALGQFKLCLTTHCRH